jgi:ribosomal protein L32
MGGGGVGGGCEESAVDMVRVNAAERGNLEARPASRTKLSRHVLAEALKMKSYHYLSPTIDYHYILSYTAMAAIRAPSSAFLSAFLPIARAQLFPASTQPITKRIPLLQRLRASSPLLPAALIPIPSLLSDLWNGILNAVPKKKTSHMKKRHRQMAAGKHLRDVTALNKCSACGRAKRAHVLCPYCVQSKSSSSCFRSAWDG